MSCHTWFYRKGFKSLKGDADPLRTRVNGHWYINEAIRPKPKITSGGYTEEYHNLFRVDNNPNERLFSLEETEAFILKKGIKHVFWEDLREFWTQYSDGMIEFG
jgi:hypothetical protein